MDVGGAVLGRLEDHRVDEPDERGVRDAVVDLEVVGLLLLGLERELLFDRGARAERLGGTSEPPDLRHDVVARGDSDVERMAGREPELVDPLDVAWIYNGDPKSSVLERVGNRNDALEHV